MKNHTLSKELVRMESDEKLILEVPHIKQNNMICFQARIDAFDKLIISHGKDRVFSSSFVEIDTCSVTSYFFTRQAEQQEIFQHGLEIKEYVDVIIRVADNFKANVIITSATGSFSCEITWRGCTGEIMAECENSSFRDCKLTFYCPDYDKKIWAFGDSYVGICPGNWPQVLNGLGYKNYMVDGISGRTSEGALVSLERCFTYGSPEKILWGLGMNDGDSEEGINQSWLETMKRVEAYCKEKDIELILMTIPNVPGRKHHFKNEYIFNSGYRFVDINHAVGADITSDWYEGLLAGDKVHPTAFGGHVIAMKIAMEVPELGG